MRMAAKFEISSPKAGEFNWVLKSQGRTLATGESYPRRISAEKAIESLRKAAATATVADLTLKAAKTPAAASRAAKSVKGTRRTTARKATAAKKAVTPRKRTSPAS
jgi:uncharacterized protein YegP (UPF0339 family)